MIKFAVALLLLAFSQPVFATNLKSKNVDITYSTIPIDEPIVQRYFKDLVLGDKLCRSFCGDDQKLHTICMDHYRSARFEQKHNIKVVLRNVK